MLTVGFWASFLLLLVVLFEDRKDPAASEVEIEGPALHALPVLEHPGRPVLAADPAVPRVRLARGRVAQADRWWLDRRRRLGPGRLLDQRGQRPRAGSPADHLRVVPRLHQRPADGQHEAWFAWLITFGEIAIGIALLAGALTGIAAFFGAFMNMSFLLAGSASTNPVLFTMAIGLVLAWRVAGYYGVDRYLLPALGAPGGPAGCSTEGRSPGQPQAQPRADPGPHPARPAPQSGEPASFLCVATLERGWTARVGCCAR